MDVASNSEHGEEMQKLMALRVYKINLRVKVLYLRVKVLLHVRFSRVIKSDNEQLLHI